MQIISAKIQQSLYGLYSQQATQDTPLGDVDNTRVFSNQQDKLSTSLHIVWTYQCIRFALAQVNVIALLVTAVQHSRVQELSRVRKRELLETDIGSLSGANTSRDVSKKSNGS